MLVLGIDPGLADTGWGLVACAPDGSRARLIEYGVVRTAAGLPLAQRLDTIFRTIGDLIEQWRPVAVAIEQLFFAKNAKTAMVVAHGRAAAVLATARHHVEVTEFTPLQIKQALTGHGRASKIQVQMMVRAVLGLKDVPKPDHAADALAAALCLIHTLGRQRLLGPAARAAAQSASVAEHDPRSANKNLLAQARGATRKRGRR
jgi:crossover junction endodeoxyribonuclease RuvC